VTWRRWLTPGLLAAGVAANLAGLAVHLHAAGDPLHLAAAAFVVANLAWLLLEAPVSVRPLDAPPSEIATLVAYALARVGTVAAAVLGPIAWTHPGWPLLVSVALFAAGVSLRLTAIRTLGRFYSHYVVRRDDRAIVRSGPYRVVRHPAYAGMLVGHVGLVLFFLNWASVLLLIALAAAIGWRILVEERELLVLPAYRAYAHGRPRLVPGVW